MTTHTSRDGYISFECDECGDELAACTDVFHVAVERLRDEEWFFEKVEKPGHKPRWLHYCRFCKVPYEKSVHHHSRV